MIFVLCSRCHIDQPREQFGPSAEQWPSHRMCRACNRRIAQIRKHGIDSSQRAEIVAHQGGCAICGHPEPSERGWVIDHDRSCCSGDKSCPNCRRGVICQWCNTVLGNAFDRPQILRAAADYLEREPGCLWHMPVACAPSICSREETVDAAGNATYVTDALTYADDVTNQPMSRSVSRAGGLRDSSRLSTNGGADAPASRPGDDTEATA